MKALRRWNPAAGAWDRAAAAHLLRRAGFGSTRAEVDEALALGPDLAIDRVLARDAHAPALLGAAKHLLAAGEVDQLAAWWVALILSGGAPLRERFTLMWHDHFATSNAKVDDVRMMHAQNELLREHALGDFRALLHGIARDPAMLVWLDGDDNRRGAPNENFARELMELFALGRGAYGEGDVQEAARAFTGWGTQGRAFRFRSEHHDPGTKSVLGTKLGSGEEVVETVLEHPACSRFVARRLLVELVAPDPTSAWVEEAARVLRDARWDIGATVEHILRSELFFSPEARRSRIAGPVELIAASARALSVELAPAEAARAAADMGQALFRPPSVKGWDGGRSWINAGSWVARHNFLVALADEFDADRIDGAAAARSAVELLAPDLVDTEFTSDVARALPRDAHGERAARQAVGLVLTAPEHHLI